MKKILVITAGIIITAVAVVAGILITKKLQSTNTITTLPNVTTPVVTNPIIVTPTKTPPAQSSKITDITWMWKKTIMNDGTVRMPNKQGLFSVRFETNGHISGTTDCNGFGGDYTFGPDGAVTFGPYMSTLMYCEGSQESVFTKDMANVSHVMIDSSGNLVLLLKYDSGSIIFTKKPTSSEQAQSTKLCFYGATKTTSGLSDVSLAVLNLLGTQITGTFKYLPAEKDSKTGSFSGTVGAVDKTAMARTADVIWNVSAEGMTAQEQLRIVFGEGTAQAGFGEMVQGANNIWNYKDPAHLTYGQIMTDIDCNDSKISVQ